MFSRTGAREVSVKVHQRIVSTNLWLRIADVDQAVTGQPGWARSFQNLSATNVLVGGLGTPEPRRMHCHPGLCGKGGGLKGAVEIGKETDYEETREAEPQSKLAGSR